MIPVRSCAALLLALPFAAPSAAQGASSDAAAHAARLPWPKLDPGDLPKWKQYVQPSAAERSFEGIDWIPDFAQGMHRASAEGKPVLFWAMNGHPLGCT